MSEFQTKIGKITIKDGPAQAFLANDSIANVLTGMGGSLDPQSGAFYFVNNLDQGQIEASFRTSWLSKRVHSAIPKDMVRAWRSWRADSADITLIEKEERRLNVRAHTRRAELFSRLYGGACQMLGTGENTQSELRPETIRKGGLKYIHTVGRHEMTAYGLILDPGSPWFLQPESYLVNAGNGVQIPVHPSRMIRHIPSDTPDSVLMQNGGFGDPLLLSLQSTIINADTLQGTFAAIASKSKVDTVYIPGLTQMASTTQGEEQLKRRVMVAKAFESLMHVKLMDGGRDGKDSERWETFEAQLTGQPELLMAFLQMVSGASNIPMTRLVGKSADGMNATGAGDEKNYFDYIGGEQELELRPRLEVLDEVLIRSALGDRPDDVWWEWNPLFTVDEKTRAETSKLRAETTAIYIGTSAIPDEVVQAAVRAELIESGEYPNIEQAYADYEAGTLEAIIEPDEDTPDDPLIPLDENGNPRQARESRLFAANDIAARMLTDGATALDAVAEATRLTDAEPRPVYVSRRLINAQEVREHFEKQGLRVTVANDRQHVTVIYSKAPVDWFKAAGGIWNASELVVPAGGPRMMDRFGPKADAIVLMFASGDLSWRHRELLEAGCSHDFEYHCHISLSYEGQDIDLSKIEPYKGELRFSYENWEEIKEDWGKK